MNTELKNAALAFGRRVQNKPRQEILRSSADFCREVSSFMSAEGFSEARLLIQKGFYTGAYAEILGASQPWNEADNALSILVDEEFVPEAKAREIIGLLMIALDSSAKNISKTESWVDSCEHGSSKFSNDFSASKNLSDATSVIARSDPSTQSSSNPDPKAQPKTFDKQDSLKRLYALLLQRKWEDAEALAQDILKRDPGCSKGYLAKMMIEMKIDGEAILSTSSAPYFANSPWLALAIKNATGEEQKKLIRYDNQNNYNFGLAAMKKATSETAYKNAAKYFNKCSSYQNSSQLRQECLNKAELCRKERIYQKALKSPYSQQPELFKQIPGYKDANDRLKKAQEWIRSTSSVKTTSTVKPTHTVVTPPPQPRPVSRTSYSNSYSSTTRTNTISTQKTNTSSQTKKNSAGRSKQGWFTILILVLLVVPGSILLDYSLTLSLRYISNWFRWLWLPLISTAILSASGGLLFKSPSWVKYLWSIPTVLWSIIRGVLVVAAYFRSLNSGWEILGAIVLCIFMWALNAIPGIIGVGVAFYEES